MKRKIGLLSFMLVLVLQTLNVSAASKMSLHQLPYKNFHIFKERKAGYELTYICDFADKKVEHQENPCYIMGQSKLNSNDFYKAYVNDKKKKVSKDDLFRSNIVEKTDSKLVFEVNFDDFFPWPYFKNNDFSYVNYEQITVTKAPKGIVRFFGTNVGIPAGFGSSYVTYIPNKDPKDNDYSSKNVKLNYEAINKSGREIIKKKMPSKTAGQLISSHITLANIEDHFDEYRFEKTFATHTADDSEKYQYLHPQATLTKKLKNGLYVRISTGESQLVDLAGYNNNKKFADTFVYLNRYTSPKPPVPKIRDYKTYKVYESLDNTTVAGKRGLYCYNKTVAIKSKDAKRVYATSITFELLKKVKVPKTVDESGYSFYQQKISSADLKPYMNDINTLVTESLKIMGSREKNPNL